MASMESVSKLIKDGVSGEEIVAHVFDGIPFDLFDKFECGYVCNCSRERYLSALRGLPRADIDEMKADGQPIEALCQFCGKKYSFSPDEIG